MDHNAKLVERSTLIIRFDAALPDGIFDDIFKFETFSLGPEIINSDGLINIVYSKPASNKKRGLTIIGNYKYEIRKDSKNYRTYINAKNNGQALDDSDFKELFIFDKGLKFYELIRNIISYLRWHKGIKYGYDLFEFIPVTVDWTFEGASYSMSLTASKIKPEDIFYRTIPEVEISARDFDSFEEFRSLQKRLAPHHELLTDAEKLLRINSYRGAYLMLYSALEVATKNLISYKIPETEWLVFNLPSPPLTTVYSDYISKKIGDVINAEDRKELVKMTGIRNDIAHQGKVADLGTIYRHLDLVKKWINTIDALIGFTK